MLQVLQHQRTGEVIVAEAPAPLCPDEGILVENRCSVISSGTEKASVETAKLSLIERVRRQPEAIKTVIDNLKKEGLKSTINKVTSKLDSYKTFGYSCAGVVIESRSEFFAPGDYVACAGAGYATHSEIVAIPQNLACKIPDGVSFESAAFTTIGAIALQGVRQANPRIGENVAVIGLGLIGIITVQLLKANGCFVVGLDIREDNFELVRSLGCNSAYLANEENIPNLMAFTDGMGFDSVIITASSLSNSPTELALKIVRKKGRVVVVGNVSMNIPRTPFYEKEVEYTIACSYGPGRYDKNYEEYGIDYPFPYVRWTENRNMQAFLKLVKDGKVNVEKLITHRYSIENAPKAYDLLSNPNEKLIAILIEYNKREKSLERTVQVTIRVPKDGKIKVGFIGAGSFAQFYLLPALKNLDVDLHTVSTATSANALSVAKHFGFKYSTTDSLSIIKNPEIDVVFVATRHDTHSHYVLECIKSGKPVFVEKPLCIKIEELEEISSAYQRSPVPIMVGFNRRFAEPIQYIKKIIADRTQPLAMHYRINAGAIPPDHWIQNPNIGGGRIVGEVCHFIDTMVFLADSEPVSIFADAISHNMSNSPIEDTVAITMKFRDGSVGVVEYFANGSKKLEKEYLEIFWENNTAILNNFEKMSIYKYNKIEQKKFDGRKGHKEEISLAINYFQMGKSPIDFFGIYIVTLSTFAVKESLRRGEKVLISEMSKLNIEE